MIGLKPSEIPAVERGSGVNGRFHRMTPALAAVYVNKATELVRMGMMPLATIPYIKRALVHMQNDMYLPWQERHIFYDFINAIFTLNFGDSTIYRLIRQRVIMNKYEQVERAVDSLDEGRKKVAQLSGPIVKGAPEGMLDTMANSVERKKRAGGTVTRADMSIASRARAELRRRRRHMGESAEPLDELKKATYGKYIKSALTDKEYWDRESNSSPHNAKGKFRTTDSKVQDGLKPRARNWISNSTRSNKRADGIDRAIDKLTKESVEQIDELSPATHKSYRKKAMNDHGDLHYALGDRDGSGTGETAHKSVIRDYSSKKMNYAQIERRAQKRAKGLDRSYTSKNESVEQIDEISKQKMGRYIRTAARDIEVRTDDAIRGTKWGTQNHSAMIRKRFKGIDIASRRLQGQSRKEAKPGISEAVTSDDYERLYRKKMNPKDGSPKKSIYHAIQPHVNRERGLTDKHPKPSFSPKEKKEVMFRKRVLKRTGSITQKRTARDLPYWKEGFQPVSPTEKKERTLRALLYTQKHGFKRLQNVKDAVKKPTLKKESVEPINELKKSTLQSYVKKATVSKNKHAAHELVRAHRAGANLERMGKGPDSHLEYEKYNDNIKAMYRSAARADKRHVGIHDAKKKLAQEGFQPATATEKKERALRAFLYTQKHGFKKLPLVKDAAKKPMMKKESVELDEGNSVNKAARNNHDIATGKAASQSTHLKPAANSGLLSAIPSLKKAGRVASKVHDKVPDYHGSAAGRSDSLKRYGMASASTKGRDGLAAIKARAKKKLTKESLDEFFAKAPKGDSRNWILAMADKKNNIKRPAAAAKKIVKAAEKKEGMKESVSYDQRLHMALEKFNLASVRDVTPEFKTEFFSYVDHATGE